MDMKDRIEQVLAQVERACASAGRDPEDVTLVAVSKLFPLECILEAADLGVRHFGESRVQELAAKRDELRDRGGRADLEWHLVGHLQRNKVRQAFGRFDVIHSLDSDRLARSLNQVAEQDGGACRCLVQVNVSGEESKFGVEPTELGSFLDRMVEFSRIRVEGLMTLASAAEDPEEVRPQFALLRELLDEQRALVRPNADLRELSMGMSGDFAVAVEEGATLVRVGTAIFGPRT